MKEIKAYIRPTSLDTVIHELESAGAHDITVIRVDAIGAAVDESEVEHRLFNRYAAKYSSVAKLEIICRDASAPRFVEIIRKTAHTGSSGDGRVFTSEIGAALNIRNGATGNDAL